MIKTDLHRISLVGALIFSVSTPTLIYAQTTTTTTTTTVNADGSTTTTVEETVVEQDTAEETSPDDGVDLIGPTGVTGTIRRSDRRQDRRREDDLEEIFD